MQDYAYIMLGTEVAGQNLPDSCIINSMKDIEDKLKKAMAEYSDFPKPGILFKDLNPLYKDPILFAELIDLTLTKIKHLGAVDIVAGVEARGFILGSAIAQKLRIGFIPVRKKGKLPGQVSALTYELEYGSDTLEVQQDTSLQNARVLVIDDVFATGGTLKAVVSLLQPLVKSVTCAVLYDIKMTDIKNLGVKSVVILP